MTQFICGILVFVGSVIGILSGLKLIADGAWEKWGPKPEEVVVSDNSNNTKLTIDPNKQINVSYPGLLDYNAVAYLGNMERPVGEVLTLFLVTRENGHNEYIVTDRGHTYIGRMYVPLTTPTK